MEANGGGGRDDRELHAGVLSRFLAGRQKQRQARRAERDRCRQMKAYFRVMFWREHHEIYLRVLAIIAVAQGRDGGPGASTTTIKEILFYYPGRDDFSPESKFVRGVLMALRTDGLIRRTDDFRADSIGARYALTIMGEGFLLTSWVQDTLATFPSFALPSHLRVD